MIPLLALLVLSGCSAGDNAQELALRMRTEMLEATRLELMTNATADYGGRVYEFSFRYSGSSENGEIEITAPDAIAGLQATVGVTEGTLSFDGAALETGAVTGDGLSPAESIPVLLAQWRGGYISGCGFEKLGDVQALAVTTDVTDTVTQKTWFDAKTLLPIRSELSDNGRMVVACAFDNVIIE